MRITRRHLADRGLKYEDLIAAADAVVGKPGYGIVSECIANGTALLYSPRSRFAEQDVFEREMPAFVRCRRIEQQDLLDGQLAGTDRGAARAATRRRSADRRRRNSGRGDPRVSVGRRQGGRRQEGGRDSLPALPAYLP